MADENGAGRRDRRRTRADYERGLPGYHDPTAGFGGSSPARSALTLRALLAVFGLVVSAGGAWFAFAGGSVHFLANDIAFSVYQDLASRNGGESSS